MTQTLPTARIITRPAAAVDLEEFRCVACGYGIVVRTAPERCPMCRASVWVRATRRRERADHPLHRV